MELLLLVFALIQSSQLDGIQKLLDLRFGQYLFFADNFQDALAALVCFTGQFRGFFIANDWIQGSNDADRGFHIMFQHLLVHRNSINALGTKYHRGVVQKALGFNHRQSGEWFVRIQFELAGMGAQVLEVPAPP